MNDQTGLHAAVIANRYEICEYLLNLKLKKLNENDIFQYQQQNILNETKRLNKSRTSSQISTSNKSTNSNGDESTTSGSFFDHLKNVFLDIKSYDPYIINYTANLDNEDHVLEEEEEDLTKPIITDETNIIYFNPIEIDTYSKFGTTCLHETVRNKNFNLLKLLLNNGANFNLPIYGSNEKIIQSNCLCEALIQKDEKIFSYLLENCKFDEFNFNLAFKLCVNLGEMEKDNNNDTFYSKTMISHFLKLKFLSDSEHKISLKNKSSFKTLINSISSTNVSNLNSNFENGLILNWNNLEPKLSLIYESWLLNSTRYFINSNRSLRNSNSIDIISSALASNNNNLINEDDFESVEETQIARLNLNLKRLHLNVITRIDLSENKLEHVPFALFQIESLKYLKLTSNKLTKLPVNRLLNKNLDDVNNKLVKFERSYGQQTALNLSWNCNNLEEIELDKNQLIELPQQLFQIKSLKHLNASFNNIEFLPIEIWLAPSLIELNVAFNQITHLPLISKCIKDNLIKQNNSEQLSINRPTTRSRRGGDLPTTKQRTVTTNVDDHPLKHSQTDTNLANKRQMQISYEEKPVQKANFWHSHTLDTTSSKIATTNLNDDLDSINQQQQADDKLVKSKQKLLIEQKLINSNSTQQKESKLIDLNLSNNKFKNMPECLSCLTPKLVKLNLSSNKLESMGAICDLPVSLKFLDLSNNCLKRSMRLLNENLLKFIIFYSTKYANNETGDNVKQLIEQNLSSLLLDNEFCYLNMFKKYFLSNENKSFNKNIEKPMFREQRLNRENYLIPTTLNDTNIRGRETNNLLRHNNPPPPPVVVASAATATTSSNVKRRARSQSRSHRNMIQTQAQTTTAANRRILPFDLFLINLKYSRSYSNDTNENELLMTAVDILLEQNNNSDYDELEKKEKILLNNQNIQIFLEQMCPHKRHLKLENLKSLNLSQNKLKHFHLMFDLESDSINKQSNINDLNFISSHYSISKEIASLSLANETNRPKTIITNEIPSTDSEFSLSESELSSLEDFDFIKSETTESLEKPKKSKSKLKDKLESTLNPLKKKLTDKKNKNLLSFNRNEERIRMISKLMFPNLTHLDFSSNRIRFIPGNLVFLENLSYLNTSSNKYLIRVSPRIGLLNKLWNFDLKNCENLRDPANLDNLIKQRTKTADILGFLKSILEDSRQYTRIKLMFVGVQAIGKTSVLNRLREESGSLNNSFTSINSNRQSWSERTSQQTSTSFLSHLSSSLSNNQNISTVGIDINEWIYEKANKKNSSSSTSGQQQQQQQSVYIYQMENSCKFFGPITFRTWDFAGQRDYYATHQYFISKRALYLGSFNFLNIF